MKTDNREANRDHPDNPRDFTTFQDLELSLWQSTVEEVFQETGEEQRQRAINGTLDYCEAIIKIGPEESPLKVLAWLRRKRNAAALVSGYQHLRAFARHTMNLGLFNSLASFVGPVTYKKFEENRDPLWSECLVVYGRYSLYHLRGKGYRSWKDSRFGNNRPDYSVIDDRSVLRDDDETRIAIIGDWGTGEEAARNVLEAAMEKKPHLLIHLGDIYYSGTKNECENRFLQIVRSKISYDIPVYTLAGNHDYYAAGTGYYWLIDNLNRRPNRALADNLPQQRASYFCLRNKHWQLLAMDTGYNDAVPRRGSWKRKDPTHITDLHKDEWSWHEHQLGTAGERKTILLSHHQLFSTYDKIGVPFKAGHSFNRNLRKGFSRNFKYHETSSKIHAWFWGHEHDYLSFAPGHLGLDLGVCIGHGAIPVRCSKREKEIPAPYRGLPMGLKKHTLKKTANGRYYKNGFSILTLDGPNSDIEHFEVDGSHSQNSPIAKDVIFEEPRFSAGLLRPIKIPKRLNFNHKGKGKGVSPD